MNPSRFPTYRLIALALFFLLAATGCAGLRPSERRTPEQMTEEKKAFAHRFSWWPTDAKPAPFEDKEKGGYWWWPSLPGEVHPWGNRGYVFIRKIIFDEQGRPHLLIKRVVRNVKVYYDFDKSELRSDALPNLEDAVGVLKRDAALSLLLTGSADVRGTEQYNLKLAARRAASIRDYLIGKGVAEERIKILSRGELDAVAPVTDLVGMQKDRNVHFMVAEVEEIQIPESQMQAKGETSSQASDQTVIEEVTQIETPVRVATKEYVVQRNDSLWKVAQKVYGDGNQWRRLYEYNRERLHDSEKLKPGQTLEIPIE